MDDFERAAVAVQGLVKRFGALTAVQDVSFSVQPGEIFSLLGPNGAGKSTTISILSGLIRPDAGDALLMGRSILREPQEAKACLGVTPQEIALYPDLTARENLLFWGKLYGLRGRRLAKRVDEVLEIIGLVERQKDRVGTFSGGMKRRVNIGVALLHEPAVLILDEPTVGIDPQSRRHILENVKELNRQGMTVLYTTHYMEEAAELSDRIAIMDQGKIIAGGSHDELIQMVGERTRIDLGLNVEARQVLPLWQTLEGVVQAAVAARVEPETGEILDASLSRTVTMLVEDSNQALPRLFEAAARCGARITSVDIQEPNLETVFLHLTGRALRD